MKVRLLIFTALLLTTLSCSHMTKKSSAPALGNTANLTLEEAELRAKQVENVRYNLEFDLTTSEKSFTGKTEIRFNWLKNSSPLRIDFFQGEVKEVVLNGQKITPNYNNHFFTIAAKELKIGENNLLISFEHNYASDGMGLTRFVDPEDKKVYLHTQFETFYANRVFPCFDQPDIKATYKTQVTAPQDWLVTTSVLESEIKKDKHGHRLWHFPESAKFSTYIYSLVAGPYHVWEDKNTRIPLRLFVRKSLARFVKPQEWFTVTKQGFSFFNEYFGYTYPYKKYDQLIVPAFNAGAMENVANVTFSERFVSRGTPTRAEKRGQANVILHEMAHMWFGDLVTMKWWNDLWLNESFATYMASLASARSTEYKEAWRLFAGSKVGASWEDQSINTHPIEGAAPDVHTAGANFDGITYGKGAAVLKQFAYYIGDDNFRKGLNNYFKTYAEKNTQLSDFMNTMSMASGRDLKEWKKLWLQTANINSISLNIACEEGKISKFEILQTAPKEYNFIRPHAFEVSFLNVDKNFLQLGHSFKAEITKANTAIPQALSQICPSLVFPNFNDHGYLKVVLDETSLENVKDSINKIQDPLLRQQLWYVLWDMVRDARFSLVDYGQLALNSLKIENDELILRAVLNTLHGGGRGGVNLISYFYQGNFQQNPIFKKYITDIENTIWQRLQTAAAGSELQNVWFEALIAAAESEMTLKRLHGLLNGKISFRGLKIDQDQRWSLISRLAAHDFPGTENLIRKESLRDPSFNGKRGKIISEASRPRWDIKRNWITEFKNEKSKISYSEFRWALGSLFPRHQTQMRNLYSNDFFKDVLEISKKKESHFASLLSYSLAPFSCDASKPDPIDSFLREHQTIDPLIIKPLRSIKQEGERCRAIIQLATQAID